MEELGLVGDIAVLAAAAFAGGAIARLLRLPTVIGYLAAGVAIGPNTPGPVGDVRQAQTIADLGVALLMFTIGVQFSLGDVLAAGWKTVPAGLVQVAVIFAAGMSVALMLGLEGDEASVFAAVAAVSSTVIPVRLLEQHHQLYTDIGKWAVGFSLVQDLCAVLLIAIVAALGNGGSQAVADIGLSLTKAVALVTAISLTGAFLLPPVLRRVAASASRDLFLLALLALALGTASLSFAAGLSVAFGAFLAGFMISEAEIAHRTLVEMFPLREVFAVIFFVAVGMLVDPNLVVDDTRTVLSLVALGLGLKGAFIGGAALLLQGSWRSAILAGASLGQMGEFSFVILRAAVTDGIVGAELNASVLTAVALSMAISSLGFVALLRWLPHPGPPLKIILPVHPIGHQHR